MSETPLPSVVEIEPTAVCNIRCRMCHVSFLPEIRRPILDPHLVLRLAPLRDAHFIIGSGFEPAMHPDLPEILTSLARMGSAYEIITNATILTDKLLAALVAGNVRHITFSFDGVKPETYEHIRRGADYHRTLRNITRIREAFRDRDTLFAVNSTIMRCNLEEIPDSIPFWDEVGFHLIRFISMVIREREPWLLRESLYPMQERYCQLLEQACCDVIENRRMIGVHSQQLAMTGIPARFPDHCRDLSVHSDHPQARRIPIYRSLPQVGEYPGMWFGCRSPWTFARIMNDGDVQLCYQYSIGNLYDAPFEEIWNGALATEVRNRVMTNRKICPRCDYFRFCLSNRSSGATLDNYFAGPLLPLVDRVDFATGEISKDTRDDVIQINTEPVPRLIQEGRRGFNIVEFKGTYIALAQSLGPIDVARIDRERLVEASSRLVIASRSLVFLTRQIDHMNEQAATPEVRQQPVPQLLEEGRRGFNVVVFEGMYFGLSQSLGTIDVARIDQTWLSARSPNEVIVSQSLDDLFRQIDEIPAVTALPVIAPEPVPVLVEEGRHGFNIVEFDGTYFGLSQSLGEIDVAAIDEIWLSTRSPNEVFVSRSLHEVTRQIDELAATETTPQVISLPIIQFAPQIDVLPLPASGNDRRAA